MTQDDMTQESLPVVEDEALDLLLLEEVEDTSWMPQSQKIHLADDEHINFTPHVLMHDGAFVILDTETTGLDHKTESLLEIAAVKLLDGVVIETFNTLVNPQQAIRGSSFKIHNISEEMVEGAPTIDEVIVKFADFIGDLPYVAHNVVFDYSFITEAYKKYLKRRFLNPRVCTQELYYSLFPEEASHGLSSLATKFGEESHVNHRALDDTMQLAAVFPRLRKLYLQKHQWKYSQLENINYLVERYLRLQKSMQTMQSEMADLKDIFKLYFAEGGHPIKSTSGEVLTAALRRQYDYDSDALMDVVEDHDLIKKVSRVNLRQVDRLIGDKKNQHVISEDARHDLISTRKAISQNWTIELRRPDAPRRNR